MKYKWLGMSGDISQVYLSRLKEIEYIMVIYNIISCKLLYYFFTAFGTILLGLGTLLLRIGGLLALSKADTVLMNVLEIKDVSSLMRQEQKAYFAKNGVSSNIETKLVELV